MGIESGQSLALRSTALSHQSCDSLRYLIRSDFEIFLIGDGIDDECAAGALLGVMPDALAVKIVSTPGSTIVFLFEYVFATEIPSDIAEDALTQLLNFMAGLARYNNALDPPQPTVLLVP